MNAVVDLRKGMLRRILHGLGAGAFGQVVTVIIQLAGVPILLHAWGTELYGEWLILFAVPAYLSMADLGFSQSAANDMTAHIGWGDTQGSLCVFQSLFALVLGTATFGLVLVALLLAGLPLERWVHFDKLSVTEVRWIMGLLAAEVLVRLLDGVNHAGFRSHGDYALHGYIYAATLLTQMAAVWMLALAGYGPLAAAAAFLAVRLIETPAAAVWLRHRHPDLVFGFGHARLAELRRLWKPSVANLSLPLAMALSLQGLILVVGATLGAIAVVVFSTLRTLTRLALQAVWKVAHAFEPEMAMAWGAKDRVLLLRLFRGAFQLAFVLSLAAAGLLAWLGPWTLSVWTHGKVSMHPALFHWLLASAIASVFWYTVLTFLKAGNRHMRATLAYALCAAGVVLASVVLTTCTHRLADVGLVLVLMDATLTITLWRQMSCMLDVEPRVLLLTSLDPRPATRKLRSLIAHELH